jgi:hypothetical protein
LCRRATAPAAITQHRRQIADVADADAVTRHQGTHDRVGEDFPEFGLEADEGRPA